MEMAERGRFELPVAFQLRPLSRRVHSTTLPPLRVECLLSLTAIASGWQFRWAAAPYRHAVSYALAKRPASAGTHPYRFKRIRSRHARVAQEARRRDGRLSTLNRAGLRWLAGMYDSQPPRRTRSHGGGAFTPEPAAQSLEQESPYAGIPHFAQRA
jgi:hypothetical protein